MGLDQYLYKRKIKCTTKDELVVVRTAEEIADDVDNLSIYEDLKVGKTDKFLEHCFLSHFIDNYKAGDKETIDKFNTHYVPMYIKAYDLYIANKDIDFKSKEIGYWRKLYDLQDYMRNIYYERGGTGEFNCNPLILSKEDCEAVLKYSKESLENIDTDDEDAEWDIERWKDAVEIFERAIKETDWDNETVYYDSWW